jgi:hypothetical protein
MDLEARLRLFVRHHNKRMDARKTFVEIYQVTKDNSFTQSEMLLYDKASEPLNLP